MWVSVPFAGCCMLQLLCWQPQEAQPAWEQGVHDGCLDVWSAWARAVLWPGFVMLEGREQRVGQIAVCRLLHVAAAMLAAAASIACVVQV